MKVLVTAISFSSKMSGIQRHAFNLVRCLLLQNEVSRVDLVIAPWQQEMVKNAGVPWDSRLGVRVARVGAGSISRNLWHFRSLPGLATRMQPDVVHLTYPVPIDADRLRVPVVLTLHDLYPYEIPSNFGLARAIVNRMTLRQCLQSVDAIACVSDSTQRCLKRVAPGHISGKAVRIYNCVETVAPMTEKLPLSELHGKRFLLCVAQHRRNKNITLLLRSFSNLLRQGSIHASTCLLIVGIQGPETTYIRKLVADRSLSGHILFRDGLPDSQLQWCYENCEALVVPSKTEGFGLPVAEGLLAGSRVICSKIPALLEIGGDHCRYFELGKAEEQDLANSIATSLGHPKPGAIAMPQLGPEVVGNAYLALYRQVIERRFAGAASPSGRNELRDGSALREA